MRLRHYLNSAYALMVEELRRLGASIEDAVDAIERVFVTEPEMVEVRAADKEAEGWKRNEQIFADMDRLAPPGPRRPSTKKKPGGEVTV